MKDAPFLTLPATCISENCIKIRINLNFYFRFSLWCLKRFYEGLKAFIKPFESPQKSVKIKFMLIFSLRPGSGREGLRTLSELLLINSQKGTKTKT